MAPATPDDLMQIAQRHHQTGCIDQAEQTYWRVLDMQPENADALHLLGLIALQRSQPGAAVDLIERSLRFRPHQALALANLGVALAESGRHEEAEIAYRRSISLDAGISQSHSSLGNLLSYLGRLDEAVNAYRRAIALKPTALLCRHLGDMLQRQQKFTEAIAAYSNSIELDPSDPAAFFYQGNSQFALGLLDDAAASFRHAISLKPDHADACRNLGTTLHKQCRLDEAIAWYERAMSLEPDNAAFHSDRVFCMYYHPDYTAEQIYQELRRWNERHAKKWLRASAPHENKPNPQRQIRVGYVSPDFTMHAMSRFLLPIFEHHDHEAFHITGYSDARNPDATTLRFRELADVWQDVEARSDEQLAELIRQDQIDILIDLSMHTANNRLLTFARKPSPLQVSWLACPGGTGMDAIDYRITDVYLDPPGLDDAFFAEKLLRMPHCWCCFQPPADTPPVNELPAMSKEVITFGCLNNFGKVTRPALFTWSSILKEVSQSRLILHSHPGSHCLEVANLFEREGVDPARLTFAAFQPEAEFLRLHHEIDLALDPFPYSGGTTSCMALWMGVPIVSLMGRTAAGRGTATLLHNVGLSELVADSLEVYVRLAVRLARDRTRLSQLRAELRSRMNGSPLIDATQFVRSVESHYRSIWNQWCLGRADDRSRR